MSDAMLSPDPITVKAGQAVTFVVRNQGPIVDEFGAGPKNRLTTRQRWPNGAKRACTPRSSWSIDPRAKDPGGQGQGPDLATAFPDRLRRPEPRPITPRCRSAPRSHANRRSRRNVPRCIP